MLASSIIIGISVLVSLAMAYTPSASDIELFKRTLKQGDVYDHLPESETTGSCSKQSSTQVVKRNCRYGKCEQTKNGTDYVCHCDQVKIVIFISFSAD